MLSDSFKEKSSLNSEKSKSLGVIHTSTIGFRKCKIRKDEIISQLPTNFSTVQIPASIRQQKSRFYWDLRYPRLLIICFV